MSRRARLALPRAEKSIPAAEKLERIRKVLREFAPTERSYISNEKLDERINYFSKSTQYVIESNKKVKDRISKIQELVKIGNMYSEILDTLDIDIIQTSDNLLDVSRYIENIKIMQRILILP